MKEDEQSIWNVEDFKFINSERKKYDVKDGLKMNRKSKSLLDQIVE